VTGPHEDEQEAFERAKAKVADEERESLVDGFGEDGPAYPTVGTRQS
jgi:hypothetical protein